MWSWVLPTQFLSQSNMMLYKFVHNTVRALGRENHVFPNNYFLANFRLVVEFVRDAVCFFGKIY